MAILDRSRTAEAGAAAAAAFANALINTRIVIVEGDDYER
jgi:hypothetical protein